MTSTLPPGERDLAEAGTVRDEALRQRATATGAAPRILVVFATRHGSTAEVAEAVAEELRAAGVEADVAAIASAPSPAGHDAVVVGGPMIMGWHKDAIRYVTRHEAALAKVPSAFFVTAASLTETGEDSVGGVPVVKDSWLVKAPRKTEKLGYRERYARPGHYLQKVFRAAPRVRPRSVAFFGGALDLTKMNVLEKLFVVLVIGATPGDLRHWDAIRDWARSLPGLLETRPGG
jgi:menaquinone-dependent protoporphyrinogen oxidase